MATKEAERMQQVLDDAFACFKQENPEVAAAIDALRIPYAEYLRLLSGLSSDIQSVSGNNLIF